MNLTRLAMRRPISVVIMIAAMAMVAMFAVFTMRRDIMPMLGVPTIYVAQPYGGLSPAQMESYLTYYFEYHFLYIAGIEHIESRNIESAALIKLQFYPGTDMAAALAETVSNVSRARAFMPPGTVPPFVIRYDSGSAPVGDLVFESEHRTLGELQNLALNAVRPLFATLKGVSAPPPFGASARSIVVNIDPAKLRRYSLSAADVADAIVSANKIVPAGNIPVGNYWPIVPVNSVVTDIQTLLDVPIRTGTVPTVYLKDVGNVQDSTDITTCYADVNGKRTVYIPVTKRADASTLAVVDLVKKNIPRFEAVIPKDVKIRYEFDQSVYVRRSIRSLLLEILLGAGLTGLMVLLFLRDLRSALIVILNIPIALLSSVLALWICGQTVNVMTLGGLALAVGILVDETTVSIENIHVHLAKGSSRARAALEASLEIIQPLTLTLLCVLSVFLPSFFMQGIARALFVPLTLGVGFAMIGSYLLSRTFVPILSAWILPVHAAFADVEERRKGSRSAFERFRERYRALLQCLMRCRGRVVIGYLVLAFVLAAGLAFFIGKEIFPLSEESQFKVRIRAPTGSTIDATEKVTLGILRFTDQIAGEARIRSSLAFIGSQPPEYPINYVYQWTSGPQEAVLNVAFKENAGMPMAAFKEALRRRVHDEMPDVKISFEPSGLVDSMMSEGAPTPIEIAVNGPDLVIDRAYADELRKAVAGLPFLRDLEFGQVYDYPSIGIDMDRPRAGLLGVTVADAGKAIVPATSSTRFTMPNYWSDPKNGVNYQVQIQIPQGRITSIEQLKRLPITVNSGSIPLSRFAKIEKGTIVGEFDRYDMERMVSLTANLHDMDLGHAIRKIEDRVKPLLARRPRGVEVRFRGQMASFGQLLTGLSEGLALSITIVFFLLAAYFESFGVAFSILATIPSVLSGSLALLFVTGTHLNIESFMGMIMAIGISVSNSILLVAFAERYRRKSGDSIAAAVEGAVSRIRPILMTASAMLMGMVPMSLGLSEGGKQSAPLGRAVMGGLIGSTFTTLLILPLIFAIIQRRRDVRTSSLDPSDPAGIRYERPQTERRAA